MKLFYYLLLLLFPSCCKAQAGMWTWMKGESTPNSAGNFGVHGLSSRINEPPALYAPAFWTDTAGKLWVFGGMEFGDGVYPPVNALWKFDPDSLTWTWMNGSDTGQTPGVYAAPSGVFSPANNPGAIGFGISTWTDKHNHLWMFGGFTTWLLDGYTSGEESNDLWQYDPAINEWAWMSGSQGQGSPSSVWGTKEVANAANMPGGRNEMNSAWVDTSGNLWFFSGWDGGNDYNDMWKYDVGTGLWAWMSGMDSADDPGSYGPLGVPSVNYYPSARESNFHWQDSQGNFWLIGGVNWYLSDSSIFYSDIWKFNPATLEWTLVKGSDSSNLGNISSGNCQSNTQNRQSGRFENRATWQICDDLIINYGGYNLGGGANNYITDMANDLWAYLPGSNEWLEINEHATAGSYGAEGIASANNYPTARGGMSGFIDRNNNIWMFGGVDSLGNLYNDLWRFLLDSSCLNIPNCGIKPQPCNLSPPAINAANSVICPTDSTQICAPGGFPYYYWNTNAATQCIEANVAGNYYVTVSDANGCTAQSNHVAVSVLQSTQVSISRDGDTLFAYGASSVQWYLNNNPITGANSNFYIANSPGNYTVQVTDTDGCSSLSSPVLFTGIENISNDEYIIIYPNPLSVGSWQLAVGNNLVGSEIEIFDDNGRIVYKSEIKKPLTEIAAPFAGGVYLLRITTGAGVLVRKLVKLQ